MNFSTMFGILRLTTRMTVELRVAMLVVHGTGINILELVVVYRPIFTVLVGE